MGVAGFRSAGPQYSGPAPRATWRIWQDAASMRQNHFTRPTIVAALAMLDSCLSQAKFDHLVLGLGLEDRISSDPSLSVSKKSAQLGRLVLANGAELIQTLEGLMTLTEATVRAAIALMLNTSSPSVEQERLLRALALDGFVVHWGEGAPHLRIFGQRYLWRLTCPQPMTRCISCSSTLVFMLRLGIWIKPLMRTPEVTGRRPIARPGHSWKACSIRSQSTLTKQLPLQREVLKTAELG